MKICIVTSSFPQYPGHYAGSWIKEQGIYLAEQHEVHIIYLNTERSLPNQTQTDPFQHHPIHYPFKTYPMSLVHGLDILNTPRLLVAMAQKIRQVNHRFQIDLFYAFWTIPNAFITRLVCPRTPLLLGLMGSDIKVFGHEYLTRPFISYSVRHASRIIAVSSDVKQEAIELGAKGEIISVIPSGVDVNKFQPQVKEAVRNTLNLPEGVIWLYVGSLFRLKRVDRIIKLGAALSKEFAFSIVIVGGGPERKALEELAQQLGVTNIQFRGEVPREEVPSYMAAADIFLIFSETEGMPGVVQEAMASGLPVIATNVGGLPDVIQNGVNGYIIKNEAEAEPCLRQVMSSTDIIEQLGAHARDYAEQNLSKNKVHRQIGDICQSLLPVPIKSS